MPAPERLSIVQVTPHRRATENPVNQFVERVSAELEGRGHRIQVAGVGDQVKKLLRASTADIVHVHDPFAPRVSSSALRHSSSLNVATFHAVLARQTYAKAHPEVMKAYLGT